MKLIIKIVSYILAFLLMLVFLGNIILNTLTHTILNTEYVLAKLEETNYYDKAYYNVIQNVEEYIEQSGLEKINIENVIEKEEVKQNVNKLFTSFCNGEEIDINNEVKSQQAKLMTNLEEELAENGITLTNKEKESLYKIVETITNEYMTEVFFGSYGSYLNYIPKIILTVRSTLDMVKVMMIISTIALIFLILIINIKQFRLGLKYIGRSSLANGIILVFLNLFVQNKIDIENFSILSQGISDFINIITKDLLGIFTTIGGITCIIGLILIFIGATCKKAVEKK